MTELSFRISRGVPGDAAGLAEFAARTYAETFGHATEPEDLKLHLASSYGVRQQTEELARADMITLLARSETLMAGFAQVRSNLPPSFVTGEAPVELWRFYVDRPWQGRGLARRLMDSVHEAARELGGRTLWLSVWEHNTRAIRFYQKCGFRDAGPYPYWMGNDLQTDRIMVTEVAKS